jgi:hypothetical protein
VKFGADLADDLPINVKEVVHAVAASPPPTSKTLPQHFAAAVPQRGRSLATPLGVLLPFAHLRGQVSAAARPWVR